MTDTQEAARLLREAADMLSRGTAEYYEIGSTNPLSVTDAHVALLRRVADGMEKMHELSRTLDPNILKISDAPVWAGAALRILLGDDDQAHSD